LQKEKAILEAEYIKNPYIIKKHEK